MAKSKALATVPEPLPVPEPNARTVAAIERAKARVLARRKRIAVKLGTVTGGIVTISAPHTDEAGQHYQMLDTFGTASNDFASVAFSQMLEAMRDRDGSPTQIGMNAALAIVDGLEPDNEVEALLAVQMAATHGLAMTLLGRSRRAETTTQVQVHGGLAVKLLRTFTLQAEALARLRRGGGQTVRVEHVHVHAGGQAIVGSVTPRGGAPIKSEEQPRAKHVPALTHADAPFDPLRSTHTERERVPVPRHA